MTKTILTLLFFPKIPIFKHIWRPFPRKIIDYYDISILFQLFTEL